MKLREIVYMVLEKAKMISDDRYIEPEHIIFLASHYRNLLLKQRYSGKFREVARINFQTLCLELEEYTDHLCGNGPKLRTKEPLPELLRLGDRDRIIVSSVLEWRGKFEWVNQESFNTAGENSKYTKHIVYVSQGSDRKLYFKSTGRDYTGLQEIKIQGVFEDYNAAESFECKTCDVEETEVCDPMDKDFPMESYLLASLLDMINRELFPTTYIQEDNINNASDDLAAERPRYEPRNNGVYE